MIVFLILKLKANIYFLKNNELWVKEIIVDYSFLRAKKECQKKKKKKKKKDF